MQSLPPRDVILAFDPLRRKPVDYAEQSSSLVGLGHDHLNRIRSRAENPHVVVPIGVTVPLMTLAVFFSVQRTLRRLSRNASQAEALARRFRAGRTLEPLATNGLPRQGGH
jgi:hypothetical protein